MSELFDDKEVAVEPVVEPPKQKKKREMTPERKKALLENLARGRQKAKENREKRLKEKQEKVVEPVVKDKPVEPVVKEDKDNLRHELAELKEQMKLMRTEKLKQKEKVVDEMFNKPPVDQTPPPPPPKPKVVEKVIYSTHIGSIWDRFK